jgi:Uma2 family endonuclease
VATATVDVRLAYMDTGASDEPKVRRLTADEAIRMSEAGILRDDEHFELLGGELVDSDPATGHEIIRRFTGDEAVRMVDVGILGEDEHFELLDGALVEMSPQGPPHSNAILRLAEALRAVYKGRGHIREEKPFVTSPHDLPEPDISLIRGRIGDYAEHPAGRDAILIIEIAHSSQSIDRRKAAIYAAGRVGVYWLVDLMARKLEVRTVPEAGSSQATQILGEDDEIALPESSERWFVRDLLPAA